jgi:hypothetical protein
VQRRDVAWALAQGRFENRDRLAERGVVAELIALDVERAIIALADDLDEAGDLGGEPDEVDGVRQAGGTAPGADQRFDESIADNRRSVDELRELFPFVTVAGS